MNWIRGTSPALLGLLALLCLQGVAPSAPLHGDLHGQILLLDRQILEDGSDPRLWLRRASLRRVHGELKAALVDLERAEELAPSLARIWYLRARVLADQEQWNSAGECAERFLSRVPGDAAGAELRSRIRAVLGDTAGALEDLTLAILNQPAPAPELYLTRARMQASLGEEHLEAALLGLEQGLKRLGPAVALEQRALELEIELGRFDAALERLARQMRAARRPEGYLARRGAILRSAGRAQEALESYLASREALGRLTRKQRATRRTQELARIVDSNIQTLERDRTADRQ